MAWMNCPRATTVLPVLSMLLIGSIGLGATTLQFFALALLIGLITGAYSSIFVAAPLLAFLKERDPSTRVRGTSSGPAATTPTPSPAAGRSAAAGSIAARPRKSKRKTRR